VSKDVGLWGKFSELEKSLEVFAKHTDREYALFSGMVLSIYKKSQKFYFPRERQILEGKKFDDSVAELVRLPYPVISVLSETHIEASELGVSEGIPTKSMTLVCDLEYFGQLLKLNHAESLPANTLVYFSMAEIPKEFSQFPAEWVLYPMVYFMSYVPDKGFELRGHPGISNIGADRDRILADGENDLNTVINVCTVLNLHNAHEEAEKAPAALNKARIKKGKSGLYDYKILVVDGERWDGRHSASHSSHDGVRSHFRRGHIRRLETGKSVWVRSTIVQGSREGFVEKSYSLESKNALHQVPPSV
jgi:hypothetical protein